MVCCKLCLCVFRDNYNLSKHLSRVKPCIKEPVVINIPLESQKDTLEDKKSLLEDKKSLLEDKKSLLEDKKSLLKKCSYCMCGFSTKKYKDIHEKKCKQKDDPIRLMEIENKINPVLPDCKTTCRFCNKDLTRISYLNKHLLVCKDREEYHEGLKSKAMIINNTINNNIVNNNTINNHNGDNKLILNFGEENLNHVQIENIINLLRGIRKEFGNNQVYLMAGDFITSFDNYIREEPENNNLVIPDSKCLYAETRITNGWEKKSIDYSLNKAFKSSANELLNRKEEINETNERVFNSDTNKQIFSEVKHFANKGFCHYPTGEELRKVKSNFKLSKLKNKVILDF